MLAAFMFVFCKDPGTRLSSQEKLPAANESFMSADSFFAVGCCLKIQTFPICLSVPLRSGSCHSSRLHALLLGHGRTFSQEDGSDDA